MFRPHNNKRYDTNYSCTQVHLLYLYVREVHTGFWWGDLREGDHLKDPGVDGRIMDLQEVGCGVHGLD
jgi:hypothetical protein